MTHRVMMFALLLAIAACDDEPVSGGVAAGATGEAQIKAADFDLAASAALIRDGKVKDGESFQKAINRPERTRIDLDKDGKRDHLQVIEHRDGPKRTLEVRAIPSSKRKQEPDKVAVPVAMLEFEPAGSDARVSARYVDSVIGAGGMTITFVVPVVVGTFCHWVLIIERPIFVGVVVVVHVHHKHKHKHKKW